MSKSSKRINDAVRFHESLNMPMHSPAANANDVRREIDALSERIKALEDDIRNHSHTSPEYGFNGLPLFSKERKEWQPEETQREPEPKKLADLLSQTCFVFNGSERDSIPHWGVAAKIAVEAMERVIDGLGAYEQIAKDYLKNSIRKELL